MASLHLSPFHADRDDDGDPMAAEPLTADDLHRSADTALELGRPRLASQLYALAADVRATQ